MLQPIDCLGTYVRVLYTSLLNKGLNSLAMCILEAHLTTPQHSTALETQLIFFIPGLGAYKC